MNNYTIILAHGIARFDFLTQNLSQNLNKLGIHLGLADNELNYFKGVSRHLRRNGFNTYSSMVSFAAGVEQRARDLKDEVKNALALRPEQSKVHIIAHSMGGLDARHMIVNLGMADKIASLTTIGTPHLGTSFADWGIAHEGEELIKLLHNCIDIGGLADLTTAKCIAFNEAAQASEAANKVFYQTYASSEDQDKVFTPLKESWRIIFDAEGANDGLVARSSQSWTDQLTDGNGLQKTVRQHEFPVSADHLNEIGWWDIHQLNLSGFNILDVFRLINTIKDYENNIKNVYLEIAREVQLLS